MTNETVNNQPPDSVNSESKDISVSGLKGSNSDHSENKNHKNKSEANSVEIHTHVKSHEKRSFKNYLFEFFMLFLAVTAGFFVENIREYYVERHREEQYIASLLRDLKADTLSMDEIIASTDMQIKGLDTLLKVFENSKPEQFAIDVYYFSFKYLNTTTFFEHTDGTITQLKNAGGLRLIRQDVSDSITQYYAQVENVGTNSEFGMEQFKRVLDLEKRIFKFKLLRMNGYAQIQSRIPDKSISFLTNDLDLLNRFYNEIFVFTAMMGNCNRLLLDLKPKTRKLILFLEQNYDLG